MRAILLVQPARRAPAGSRRVSAEFDGRPSSRVIYLDFDGHTTNDSEWGPSPIVSAPFDLDGSPGFFSAGEQAVMVEVWQRVSEDFAPFDVNVTTIDPGVEALRKTNSSDAIYGQRMVISPTNFAGSGVLGIAIINSFDDDVDRPAFVFSNIANNSAFVKTICRSRVPRGRSHARPCSRWRSRRLGVLRRPWVVGTDHGPQHLVGDAGHAMGQG